MPERLVPLLLKRYWGLPWYWPNTVFLSGDSFSLGQEYLIEGERGDYGWIATLPCSRTMPLRLAQVDLRTMDGTQCSAPGGTIFGTIFGHSEASINDTAPLPGQTVSLTGPKGERYTATTDRTGVFELQHLPAGRYVLDDKLDSATYLPNGPHFAHVEDGVCMSAGAIASPYIITGRVLGLRRMRGGSMENAVVELVPQSRPSAGWMRQYAYPREDNGVYYFDSAPPGEYLLGVNITRAPDTASPFLPTYYPGGDSRKATRIHVGKTRVPGSFDFTVARAPLVSVPVVAVFPDGRLVPRWSAELDLAGSGPVEWTPFDRTDGWSTGWGRLEGIAGRHHRITVREDFDQYTDPRMVRCADPVEVLVRPGARPVRIVLNRVCKYP